MSRYQYQTSYHHKRVQARKTKVAAICAVGFVVLLAGFVIFDRIRDAVRDVRPETAATVSAVEGATISLFSTEYFQFQADKTWVEVPELNTATRFVYKSKNGPLVQHQLTIYIGKPPANEVIGTRVYPVEVSGASLKPVGSVSEHCRKASPEIAKNEPQDVIYQQVKFLCDNGNTNFRVLVGLIGGGPTIPMQRPSGGVAEYTIIYDDVTAYPSSNKIDAIISTFQSR